MKSITLIILTLIFCSQGICGDFLGTRRSKFKDAFYDFDLSLAAIDKAPKWDLGSDYPPLSAKKAQEIALALVKKIRPEVEVWHLDLIGIQPIRNSDWIYLIKYSDYTGPIAGVPWSLEIPIYMDGTVPEVKIKKF